MGDAGSRRATAEVVVRHAHGMHLRPATEFARVALASGCRVRVRVGEEEVNAASVLEIAMLGIGAGATLVITAEGEGCEKAVADLVSLVRSDFRAR